MTSPSSRERQLSTGRDVLAGREWKRTWRALSFGEKWRVVRAVHRGRAVEDSGHAWMAARYAADLLRSRGLTRRATLVVTGGMLLNLVGQFLLGRWLLVGVTAAILLVLAVALVFVRGSPEQLAAAERENRALAERTGGPL